MALVAPVENGKVVSTNSADSTSSASKAKETGGNSISSDTFLALLVAEMQNQDPLEPTSNTEWVSQYSTFTMVEQMGEMSGSMDLMRASGLVGQNVIMKTTSSTGEQSFVQGIVDFVTYEDGEAYLYINDEPYALADLDTVASSEYMDAFTIATEFKNKMAKMPTVANLGTEYETTVKELCNTYYKEMDDYQRTFIPPAMKVQLDAYVTQLKSLGVSFDDTATELPGSGTTGNTTTGDATTSNKDLLDAFNSKMDSILAALDALKTKGEEDAGNIEDSDNSSEDE